MQAAYLGLLKSYCYLVIPITGAMIGRFLDQKETERMTLFRDKSALYRDNVKPGDPPSWP